MRPIITKSLQDIFSRDVISFMAIITLGSLLVWGVLLWLFWGGLSSFVTEYLQWMPWEWLQTSGAALIMLLLGYTLMIITISALTSLFSEPLLIRLAHKHYPDAQVVGSAGIARSLLLTLKTSGLFLAFFLISIPLLFIPVFGQLWMLWLWSILIKEPTTYEVGSLFVSDKALLEHENKKARMISMIASVFNYLPVLNIFAPIFAQILFLHHILGSRV
jgi:hypothetical protein